MEKKVRKTQPAPDAKSKPAQIDKNIEAQIKADAYILSQKKLPYNDLIWQYAELLLTKDKGEGKFAKEDTKKKAEELFKSKPKVQDLCWYIAELNIKLKK
ncbi:MAG TPA: hypothetical protein VGB37_05105 [Candidatus Lokiarchaeia archaeon]